MLAHLAHGHALRALLLLLLLPQSLELLAAFDVIIIRSGRTCLLEMALLLVLSPSVNGLAVVLQPHACEVMRLGVATRGTLWRGDMLT